MKIYNVYAWHKVDDFFARDGEAPERETYYIGTDKGAALATIRAAELVSATIETWEDGKLIGTANYWRQNDHYSIIDDPNF